MRKRLIIDLDANYMDEKAIIDKIAYAAIKVLRSNRGNLIGIKQEELPSPPIPRLWIPEEGDED